ncbi:MAG: serine hydrolase [Acidobacteria bacterium]|nr:serine hydrolase [Acidobacteriota bacterium]
MLIPILLVAAASLRAADPSGAIDALFEQWNKADSPGCAVGVVKEGKVVHQKGYGSANLEYGAPITPQTAFYLGSTSKEFTGMSILLLLVQGRMKLDDPIRKFLPDLPAYMQPVTVRHLLEHSSGIRDYHGLWTLTGPEDDAPLKDSQVMEMLRRQNGLQFQPGEEFLYSNSNYFLLAQILRPAALRHLRDFAKEFLFQPLGLTATRYYDNRFQLLPKRATGYSPNTGVEGGPAPGFRINTATVDVVGDGGVFTTLEDVFRWFKFLESPQGAGAQALKLMVTPAKLNSGDTAEYGRGMMLKQLRGLDIWSHAGGLRGYRSEILWVPSRKVGAAVLCNTSNITPAIYARLAANAFLTDVAAVETPVLTQAELARKAGSFFDAVTGDIVQIAPQGRVLGLNYNGTTLTMLQQTKMRFRSVNAPLDLEIEFKDAGDKDEPRFLRVESETNRVVKWERMDARPVQLLDARQYEGIYKCGEVQSQLDVRFFDGKLLLEQAGTAIGEMQLVRTDQFRLGTMTLFLSRNAEKKVTGFRLNTGRVRGLEFTRTADQPPNQ